jgi:hypothetical protein
MGPIADRSQEHLGQSDKAIVTYRRLLRSAIDATEKGNSPPIVFDAPATKAMTGPPAIDGIGPTDDWRGYWQRTDADKRSAASWTASQSAAGQKPAAHRAAACPRTNAGR